MNKDRISVEQAKVALQKLTGQEITRVWFSYGSFLFLELGEPHLECSPVTKKSHIKGDWTLGQAPYWRLLRGGTVYVDSLDAELEALKQAAWSLEGTRIISVDLADTLTTLDVLLSSGTTIQFYKEKHDFFRLSYNHKAYLVFDGDGAPSISHNEL